MYSPSDLLDERLISQTYLSDSKANTFFPGNYTETLPIKSVLSGYYLSLLMVNSGD